MEDLIVNEFRSVIGYGREPMQQSMAHPLQDAPHLGNYSFHLGVVLEVLQADHRNNLSAQQDETRRGWRHECVVQLLNTGTGNSGILEHVVVPPTRPAGVDDFEEDLPRPSSQAMDGSALDITGQTHSLYRLDGDYCVVGYLNGDSTLPFVMSWWHNPNNAYDPLTRGEGNPSATGGGRTLDQKNRYFRRTRGVEHTVTSEGNVYFDTNYAGASIQVEPTPERGSLPREVPATGGSIRATLKDGASLEVDWNTPDDGIGLLGEADPAIRQTNPPTGEPTNTQTEKANTYLLINKSMLNLETTSEIQMMSEAVELVGTNNLDVASPSISLGQSNTVFTVNGDTYKLSITGSHTEESDSLSIVNTAFTDVTSPSIELGTEAVRRALVTETVSSVSSAALIPLLAAAAAAQPPATQVPNPASNLTLLLAIIAYITQLDTGLSSSLTTATRAN